MDNAELTRIDQRPISDNAQEIRAFMMVWNESVRLESTLTHYRQLGVQRFFVVDLGSTDGTLDLLAAEPDVHVFTTTGDADIAYLNALLDAYGAGHWSLTVDADELFVYPHCEELELPLFCRYLGHVGSQAVACVSLDMYATSPIADAVHRPGTPLLDTCRYFDSAPYTMVRTDVCPYFEIHGGVRERVFGPSAAGLSPVLSRVPLIRWQPGMQYLRGTGNVTPVAISSVLGALLRFDFLSDHHIRSGGELALGDLAFSNSNLYSDRSVKFENSAQLVELQLMKTTNTYEESVRLTAEARAAMQSRQAG